MTRNGVANPAEVTMLAEVISSFCESVGVQNSEDRRMLAARAYALFQMGHSIDDLPRLLGKETGSFGLLKPSGATTCQ